MSPQDLAAAIIAGLNAGGEQFLEGTLAAALPIVWIVILGLHLGRPYILDMIDRFTLRLGADLLWLVYVGLRDLLIVSGVVMSFMFFFPDVVVTDALPTHWRAGGGVPLRRAADQADGGSRSRPHRLSLGDSALGPGRALLLRALSAGGAGESGGR